MTREVDYLREELEHVDREIARSERAPLDHRVVDHAGWARKLNRLRDVRRYLLARIAEEDAAEDVA